MARHSGRPAPHREGPEHPADHHHPSRLAAQGQRPQGSRMALLPGLKGSLRVNLHLGPLPARRHRSPSRGTPPSSRRCGITRPSTAPPTARPNPSPSSFPYMLEAFLDSDRAFAKARKDGLPETNIDQPARRTRSPRAGDTEAASPAVSSLLQCQEGPMQIGAFTWSNDGVAGPAPAARSPSTPKVRLVPSDDRTHDNAPGLPRPCRQRPPR